MLLVDGYEKKERVWGWKGSNLYPGMTRIIGREEANVNTKW